MNNPFQHLSLADLKERFIRLKPREQALVVLVLMAALYLVVDLLVFQVLARQQQQLLSQQKDVQAKLLALSSSMAKVDTVEREAQDKQQQDLQQLQRQMALLKSAQGRVSAGVPDVRAVVQQVLVSAQGRVSVVSLKTLPVKLLQAEKAPAGATKQAGSTVYKHAVELELRGGYLDLVSSLESLESQNKGLMWSNLQLTAGRYPDSTVRATVFILSRSSGT